MGDEVARQDPGLVCRGPVHRRDHLDKAFFLRHLDSKAAEFAFGIDLHLGKVFGRKIVGMRVKRGEHAVDRSADQVFGRNLFDILRTDPLEHIAEQIQLFID